MKPQFENQPTGLRLVRYLFGDEKPEKNKFKHRYQVSKIFVEKGLSLAFLKKNRRLVSDTLAFELFWASQPKLTNSPLTTSSVEDIRPLKVSTVSTPSSKNPVLSVSPKSYKLKKEKKFTNFKVEW